MADQFSWGAYYRFSEIIILSMAIEGFGIKNQIFVPKVPSLIMSYYYSNGVRTKRKSYVEKEKQGSMNRALFCIPTSKRSNIIGLGRVINGRKYV